MDVTLDVWKAQINDALQFNPVKINTHSLRDFNTFDQAKYFYDIALKYQEQFDVPIQIIYFRLCLYFILI